MKKIVFSLLVFSSVLGYSQIRTNEDVNSAAINEQTPFLDASSSTTWNSEESLGKGLVFPRTDLTQLDLVTFGSGIGNNYPTRLDGMIVYNVATGNSLVGNVPVTPGFYYYENKTDELKGGTWKPLGSAEAPVVAGSSKVTGTFVHDGGITAVLSNIPADIKAITSIKIVRTDANGDKLEGGVAATTFYSYEKTTKTIAFGQGAMATSMPAGNYTYVVEYTR